jgi:putative endopeptidase
MKKLIVCATLLSCTSAFAASTVSTATVQQSLLASPNALSTATRIQDDFYLAVNGDWLRTAQIPADASAVFGADLPGITSNRLNQIITELAAKQNPPGSVAQKVGTFYSTYLDTATLDRLGWAPLSAILDEIDALTSMSALAHWQGKAQGRLETPVHFPFVMPGFQDPTINQAMLAQGGLGLPDRSYYLNTTDAELTKIYTAYRAYLLKLASLAQLPQASVLVDQALVVESQIAQAQWELAKSRDPSNIMTMQIAELIKTAPGFDWLAFLDGANLKGQATLSNLQPGAVQAISKLYATIPLAHWKAYTKLQSLNEAAPLLSTEFRAAHFAFYGITLDGKTQPEPQSKKAVAKLNHAMGEALGQLYVERHFPVDHKERMQALVQNLLVAYRDAISRLTWMTPATKQQALDKIAKYGTKIGYPDVWRDYSGLRIVAGDALGNQHRAARFDWEFKAAKVGKKADKRDWDMLPQWVNAQYNPLRNDIEFPAAHLQAPYFDINADDATNYGAIGALIGHEISHGFDNMGSQFDGDGNFRNWWSAEDKATFQAMGEKLVQQFSAYQLYPGKHVNGQLTLSENMADLAGLQIAFDAYIKTLKGKKSPVVNGLTGEQRFFYSYAQSRRSKFRPELATQWLVTAPHAPDVFRINGAVINIDGFHQAFSTKPGDAMFKNQADRLRIW